jgi:hypothetical protein
MLTIPFLPRLRAVMLVTAIAGASTGGAARAQETPLRHTFRADEETRYRVRLTVRSEIEAPETVKIGSVTYVKSARHEAEAQLTWFTTESVLRAPAGGEAEVTEKLESFEGPVPTNTGDATDEQTAHLAAGLRATLAGWAQEQTLEMRVAPNGAVSGLSAAGVPRFDETDPPLLTLWLLRALRPTVLLPERPIRVGDAWQEPRAVGIGAWTDVRASETGEWLEAPRGETPAVRLHVVQEISGRVPEPSASSVESPAQKTPPADARGEKTARFYAESLSTVGLDDGRLLAATRSARKELLRVLPPVEGMPEPPRFRATLSVQVEIENCEERGCESRGSH